jgi:hypothetical protein
MRLDAARVAKLLNALVFEVATLVRLECIHQQIFVADIFERALCSLCRPSNRILETPHVLGERVQVQAGILEAPVSHWQGKVVAYDQLERVAPQDWIHQ